MLFWPTRNSPTYPLTPCVIKCDTLADTLSLNPLIGHPFNYKITVLPKYAVSFVSLLHVNFWLDARSLGVSTFQHRQLYFDNLDNVVMLCLTLTTCFVFILFTKFCNLTFLEHQVELWSGSKTNEVVTWLFMQLTWPLNVYCPGNNWNESKQFLW